jgi:hypothetical protein
VLRDDYEHVAHDVLWRVVRDDLPLLERVCREVTARWQCVHGHRMAGSDTSNTVGIFRRISRRRDAEEPAGAYLL